jgi:hypothetical protein
LAVTVFYGYVDYTSDGRPFYVGKGKSRRVRKAKRNLKHDRVSAKYGFVRVVEYASKEEGTVFEWEVSTIARLNTYRTHLGCNFTRGGDGTSGHLVSPARRAEISRQMRGRICTEEMRSNMSLARRNLSPEAVANIAAANRDRDFTADARLKRADMCRGKPLSPEHRAKISAAGLGRKQTPEHAEKRAAARRGKKQSPEAVEKNRLGHKGIKSTPESRSKMSTASLGRPKSPEHREKLRINLAIAREARKKS